MSDLAYTYTLKLAAYFNQPLDFGEDNDVHPRVEAVRKFLDKMPDADLEAFYKRISDNMDHFPYMHEIRDEYKVFMDSRKKYIPDYKADLPKLEDMRVDDEPMQKLPDIEASITLEAMHEDSERMDFHTFMRKYGFHLVGIFEGLKGSWAFDHDFRLVGGSGKLREPDGGWTLDMLRPYWNKKQEEINGILRMRKHGPATQAADKAGHRLSAAPSHSKEKRV